MLFRLTASKTILASCYTTLYSMISHFYNTWQGCHKPIDWQNATRQTSADTDVQLIDQRLPQHKVPVLFLSHRWPLMYLSLNNFLPSLFSRYVLFFFSFFKKQSSHVHMHFERTVGHVECFYYANWLFFSLQFQLFSSSAKANMGLRSVSYQWLSNP